MRHLITVADVVALHCQMTLNLFLNKSAILDLISEEGDIAKVGPIQTHMTTPTDTLHLLLGNAGTR
ncbi:hypothetical protein E2C01_060594 [Portunus trituberculatus]|uniref:Uncharacterized protein n=1 Tax=Portunus trituberculatus TaxID=210409 RepID=A0A5B7H947_PORTR|nr:hypothetical protein [Portunus trituberculatus]